MTYLARVASIQRLGQKAKAEIFGVKRQKDKLWTRVEKRTLDLPYVRTWKEEQLLILELDSKGDIDVVTSAVDHIFEELQTWTMHLTKFDTAKANLEYLKQSVEYQSNELTRRERILEEREQLQRIQEENLKKLNKLAHDKLKAVEIQHAALESAWEHVLYKQNELKVKPGSHQ